MGGGNKRLEEVAFRNRVHIDLKFIMDNFWPFVKKVIEQWFGLEDGNETAVWFKSVSYDI